MILNEDQIYLNMDLQTKNDVLRFISKEAKKHQVVMSETEIFHDFIKREEGYPTAFQDGFAIPHAKSQTVTEAKLFIVTTKDRLEWNSPDHFKVKVIFGILVPLEEAGTKHIQILSALAEKLMDEDFQQKLMDAKEKKDIYSLVKNIEE